MNKVEDLSENEDDPASYDANKETGQEKEKKHNKRRSSQRLCKKPRIRLSDLTSDESGGEERKPRTYKKHKSNKKHISLTGFDVPSGFKPGSFLILKKDAQSGYSIHQPCIWKIDGKALLQKFEPFIEDGIVKHRNTSIYTGWSVLEKDLYAPIYVHVSLHAGQKMIVQMNFDQLKEINMESD